MCVRVCVYVCVSRCVCCPCQCMNGQWSSPPIVCQQVCGVLTMPLNGGSCRKTIVSTSFTSAADLLYYAIVPQVPALEASKFFVNTASGLVTGVGSQPAYSTAPYTLLVVSNPLWLQAMLPNQVGARP
jgi:hypothetical protein